ncbi:MAG: N-acetylmuramoyl-L-alanine amidase [Oscillospiraceae bacterium]|nr:N-acetylmuramoyl-L-alanine amidase [Oscillospiraceae bacterium]
MKKILEDLIPSGRKNRPAKANPVKYVTIHETGNTSKGANAKAHGNYLRGDTAAGMPVSWHYTVDSTEIRQHLPEKETAYHAGDGANGTGNAQSVGIEICINSDGDFSAAVANAIELVTDICIRNNIPAANVVQHNHWSGKNCPANIRAGRPITWAEFTARVTKAIAAGSANTPSKPSEPSKPSTPNTGKAVTYRVVAGSFADKANAEAQVRRLKLKGFESFIAEYEK